MLTIRTQQLTSATAPGMSAFCECISTAHLLSDTRIKTERGTESNRTLSDEQAEYHTQRPNLPGIQSTIRPGHYIYDEWWTKNAHFGSPSGLYCCPLPAELQVRGRTMAGSFSWSNRGVKDHERLCDDVAVVRGHLGPVNPDSYFRGRSS